jgi:hypothetical protein
LDTWWCLCFCTLSYFEVLQVVASTAFHRLHPSSLTLASNRVEGTSLLVHGGRLLHVFQNHNQHQLQCPPHYFRRLLAIHCVHPQDPRWYFSGAGRDSPEVECWCKSGSKTPLVSIVSTRQQLLHHSLSALHRTGATVFIPPIRVHGSPPFILTGF